MRGIKIKALVTALVTAVLLGSSVVMADTEKTLQPGVVFYPGDSYTLNANAYFDLNDDPRYGVREIRPGQYVFADAFS